MNAFTCNCYPKQEFKSMRLTVLQDCAAAWKCTRKDIVCLEDRTSNCSTKALTLVKKSAALKLEGSCNTRLKPVSTAHTDVSMSTFGQSEVCHPPGAKRATRAAGSGPDSDFHLAKVLRERFESFVHQVHFGGNLRKVFPGLLVKLGHDLKQNNSQHQMRMPRTLFCIWLM